MENFFIPNINISRFYLINLMIEERGMFFVKSLSYRWKTGEITLKWEKMLDKSDAISKGSILSFDFSNLVRN